ncbi:MAG: sigma-54 dependent transcriptional regulator [Pseudomonadota bacterium]
MQDQSYETLRNGVDFLLLSGEMRQLRKIAVQIASSDAPILLFGETGTGKELFARFIHDLGPRVAKPFMSVSCGAHDGASDGGAFAETFFGNEQGAFAGSLGSRLGCLEKAADGTLFLGEIAEMPLAKQADFLRVFTEKHFHRIGGQRELPFNARLIASSSRSVYDMVQQGTFRADLFYRLNVIPLRLPPLRSRPEEIIPLSRHFLAVYGDKYDRHGLSLAPQAEQALLDYMWPGNVRELKNLVERLALLAPDRHIEVKDLPMEITMGFTSSAKGGMQSIDNTDDLSLDKARREAEIRVIKRAMLRSQGNKSEAARLLGVSARTLRYKFVEYGLRI